MVTDISASFEDSVFELDFNGIYSRYKTEYTSFLKIFKKAYKNDKKAIQASIRGIVKGTSGNSLHKG
jgi:hypothetical protein